MKQILHIVLYLPYGGLEKIVYNFSTSMNGKNCNVYVAALQEGGPMKIHLEQEGIPVYVLDKKPGKFDFRLLVRLIKLIKELNINIIHSHSGCIMYAALAGKLCRVNRIVHTEHGKYFPEPRSRILEDRIFSYLLTKYVCVSKELEKYVETKTRVPKRKIITIINGINIRRFFKYSIEEKSKLRKLLGIEPDALVIGTICRLIPEKNVIFLTTWFKKYYKEHNKLILIIVGDGIERKKLEKQISDMPEGRVRFLGEREDIPDLMNVFNIFALTSITEGTSLTILEAMASQLPVVVSAVGGNTAIIKNDYNGMLFECNNIERFNDGFNKIIKMPQMEFAMGQRARKTVKEKYSFEKMLDQYYAIYN